MTLKFWSQIGLGEGWTLFLSVNLHLKVRISSLLSKHPLWQWKLSSPNCSLTRTWQSPSVYAIMATLKQLTRALSQCFKHLIMVIYPTETQREYMCTSYLASDKILYWWCTNTMLFIQFSLSCCCSVIPLEVKRDICFCHKTIYL